MDTRILCETINNEKEGHLHTMQDNTKNLADGIGCRGKQQRMGGDGIAGNCQEAAALGSRGVFPIHQIWRMK